MPNVLLPADTSRPPMNTPLLMRIVRWTCCIAIVMGIASGLFISGSPATRRHHALDEKRVNNLNQITYAIDTYAQTHGMVPTNLDLLTQDQPYLANDFHDPETNVLYAYRVLTTSTYELCATFDLPTSVDEEMSLPPPPVLRHDTVPVTRWEHMSGHVCFPLRVRINAALQKS